MRSEANRKPVWADSTTCPSPRDAPWDAEQAIVVATAVLSASGGRATHAPVNTDQSRGGRLCRKTVSGPCRTRTYYLGIKSPRGTAAAGCNELKMPVSSPDYHCNELQ